MVQKDGYFSSPIISLFIKTDSGQKTENIFFIQHIQNFCNLLHEKMAVVSSGLDSFQTRLNKKRG